MQGLYTALTVPYNSNGAADEKTLIQLLDHQTKAHVDGIVLLGSTGEGNILEDHERDRIIQTAVQRAKGKTQLMVCCGAPGTKRVLELVQRAEELGADSILAVTPFYTKPTQEGIFQHFSAVCQATSLPICIYNIASRTGQNIETSTLARLAELPQIVGVKEASGSIAQVQDVIEKITSKRSDFAVMSGDDMLTLPMIALGAHGLISVISNLLPKTTKELITEARRQNAEAAKKIHYALKSLCAACYVESNPIPLKRMLQYVGFDMGPYRLPLTAPSKAHDDVIVSTLLANRALLEKEGLTLTPELFACTRS